MEYLYLSIAIVAEVIATNALKASDGFTRLNQSIVVVVGYSAAFYFLSLVLKTVPVGVAYAIWSGAGIALITIAGAVLFKQTPDAAAVVGMVLIVSGVIVINLFSNTIGH